MKNKIFKSILPFLLIFALIFMLPITPLQNVETTTKKVKIKYVTNGGTFKSSVFKEKKAVTIKIKKEKKEETHLT